MKPKPISFRPTEEAIKSIEAYMQKHTLKDRTKAINKLLTVQHNLPVESTEGNQTKNPNEPLLCLNCVYTYRKKPPAKFAGKTPEEWAKENI